MELEGKPRLTEFAYTKSGFHFHLVAGVGIIARAEAIEGFVDGCQTHIAYA
jgi:hypothetical protein